MRSLQAIQPVSGSNLKKKKLVDLENNELLAGKLTG